VSFKPIRTFLNARLLEVDAEFEAYDAAFPNDTVGDNNFNKRFHIHYGPIATTVDNQNTTLDVATATVTLYFRGFRDNTGNPLDEAMDIANKYRLNCLHPKWLRSEPRIKRVVCSAISSEPLLNNDQAFKVVLTYSITMQYGLKLDQDNL
jgi:hypothetical protein